MTHIVSEVMAYDNKRWKVTLDEGAMTFLLYKGELHRAGITAPGGELSEEQFFKLREEILIPRAKKRALYYLKNGDKTEFQIRRKLTEGFYPEEIIETVMDFLKQYRLTDDERYAENYVNQCKGQRSRREIEAGLRAKGLKSDSVREMLSELPAEEEYTAARKALAKHNTGDRNRDFAYLARRGFSMEAIEHAFSHFPQENG